LIGDGFRDLALNAKDISQITIARSGPRLSHYAHQSAYVDPHLGGRKHARPLGQMGNELLSDFARIPGAQVRVA
jgi:hypothetical protein